MLLQVELLGHDEVIPHSQEPGSQPYQSQKERLERNEFFKDCLAPQRCVLKVSSANSYCCADQPKAAIPVCSFHFLFAGNSKSRARAALSLELSKRWVEPN